MKTLMMIFACFAFAICGRQEAVQPPTTKELCLANLQQFFDRGKTQKNIYIAPLINVSPIRNVKNWAYGPDYSAIPSTRGGVLIGRKHMLFAAHYPIAVGSTVRFVSKYNYIINRKIIKSTIHPSYITNPTNMYFYDMQLVELDRTPYPIIQPVDLLTTEMLSGFPTFTDGNNPNRDVWIINEMPVFSTDAEKKISLSEGWMILRDKIEDKKGCFWIRAAPPTNTKWQQFYEPTVSGDSGHPLFIIMQNKVFLLGLFTTPGGGALTSTQIDWFEQMGVFQEEPKKEIESPF